MILKKYRGLKKEEIDVLNNVIEVLKSVSSARGTPYHLNNDIDNLIRSLEQMIAQKSKNNLLSNANAVTELIIKLINLFEMVN